MQKFKNKALGLCSNSLPQHKFWRGGGTGCGRAGGAGRRGEGSLAFFMRNNPNWCAKVYLIQTTKKKKEKPCHRQGHRTWGPAVKVRLSPHSAQSSQLSLATFNLFFIDLIQTNEGWRKKEDARPPTSLLLPNEAWAQNRRSAVPLHAWLGLASTCSSLLNCLSRSVVPIAGKLSFWAPNGQII